jgi:phospholipase/lecithinase/hemolysin
MRFCSLTSSLLGLAALTFLAAPATTQEFKRITAVGDSLTDNGNLFALIGVPGAPYWNGRFSDGPVYVEQLAKTMGVGLQDLAVGGATTTDVLQRQVNPLVAANSGKLPADSLYVYWAGSNDLLALLSNPNGNAQVVIGNAMQQTAGAISTLLFAGAKHIMVANLPDLSKTPRVIALNDPVTSAGAQALAQAYNGALALTIQQLEVMLGVDIIEVDMFSLTQSIAANPRQYMFQVVDEPRLRPDGTLRLPENRYLFFDDIHPTFAGHRVLMRSMLRALGRAIPGDVNGDYIVNLRDLEAIRGTHGPCGSNCAADINGDLTVNGADRVLLVGMLAPR